MSEPVQTGTLIPYLIEMFRYQAWMALGKVANPMSGEVQRDLAVARSMIDLLSELEVRTEGNRSEDESRMLQGVLTELRLNYVDESKKPDEKPESKSDESEVDTVAEAEETTETEAGSKAES